MDWRQKYSNFDFMESLRQQLYLFEHVQSDYCNVAFQGSDEGPTFT